VVTSQVEVVKADQRRPVGVFDYSRSDGKDGYEYVRVWEGGRLLNIAETAFREARNRVNTAEQAETEEACRVLLEDALKCACTAEHYVRMLLDNLRPADPWGSSV
jgi:hypothetical protein